FAEYNRVGVWKALQHHGCSRNRLHWSQRKASGCEFILTGACLMNLNKGNRLLRVGFLFLILIVSLYMSLIAFTPSQMTVLAGEEYRVDFFSPFRLQLSAETSGIRIERRNLERSMFTMPYTLECTNYGQSKIHLRLFGVV